MLKDSVAFCVDDALVGLCEYCNAAAEKLLIALMEIKIIDPKKKIDGTVLERICGVCRIKKRLAA